MGKGRLDMSNVRNIITGVLVAIALAAPVLYNDIGARYEEEVITVHAGDTLFSVIAERD